MLFLIIKFTIIEFITLIMKSFIINYYIYFYIDLIEFISILFNQFNSMLIFIIKNVLALKSSLYFYFIQSYYIITIYFMS